MRVLAIGNLYPPAAHGGYERIFVDGVAALRRAGHEVRVLTTAPVPGREVTGPEPEGAAIFRELDWYWRDGGFPPRTLRESLRIERKNAQVLDAHLRWRPDAVSWWAMGGMSLSLIAQAHRRGVPAVGVVGDGWMVYGPQADGWTAFWQRRRRLAALGARLTGVPTTLSLGDGVRWLFISRAVAERSRREGHSLPRTGLAHPGVDASRFREHTATPWSWRLSCVGRVSPEKGIPTAVEALAHLPAEATLTIDGPVEREHKAHIEAVAEGCGVADRVTFALTPSEDVARAYAAADAVLFPVTWPEPWGLVPLEAMSVGRPVIATGTGGSGEYLEHGKNCLRFEVGDAAGLAAAVRRLATDDDLRERLRAGGLATARAYAQEAFERVVVAEHEAAARRG